MSGNQKLKIEQIIKFLEEDKFIISYHARARMFQRNISTDQIKTTISMGKIIESYNNSDPCPSALILGYCDHTPYHIVVAQCNDHIRIITVYKPEEDRWIEDEFRK